MMLAAKRLLVFLFIGTFCQITYGQGVNIKIIEEDAEIPVKNVRVVFLHEDSLVWISNGDGIITLTRRLVPGDSLSFNHIGFQPLKLTYRDIIERKYIIAMQLAWDDLPPVIFSAMNRETGNQESSSEVIHIAHKDIQLQNPQTSADLIGIGGKVFVQKSQLGGGSPMIRGMSANRLLIVVDGVRMNNAIFRSGNLQNILSIDPNLVYSTEVLLGPGSVVYGTDAIGGVMSFRLREPQLSTDNEVQYHGNAMTRLSSANKESTWHVDFEVRKRKVSFLSSVTMSNFGNLRMGSNGPDEYQRKEYVESFNGTDTIVKSANPNVQYFSGYTQINLMQKVRWQIRDSLNLKFGVHYGTTSPIPRYDRLIQKVGDQFEYGDWYYGQQNWLMTNAMLTGNRKTWFTDQARWTISYQNFKESRLTRPFQSTLLTDRSENVDMFTVNADMDKKFKAGALPVTLYYGGQFIHNLIGSEAYKQDVLTTEKVAASTRYPDGATWNSTSAYLKMNISIGKRWDAEAGGRFSLVKYKADLENPFFNFPFTTIDESVNGESFSAGLVYHNRSTVRLNFSTGYRAPNIDDIGKVFDSEPGKVTVPNPGLDPEQIQSIDLSWERNWNKRLLIQMNVFASRLTDAIVRDNFTLNGADSMFYEGQLKQIQALVNKETADIYGIQVYADYKINSKIKVNSTINYTKGETSDGLPLRHVSPLFGSTHLTYRRTKITYDLYAMYNGEISNKDLSTEEQSKTHIYARDNDGNPYSPAWWTLNFKTKYSYSERLSFLAGAENLLDKRYRPYSSGISAPGFNLYVAVRARF